MKPEYALVPSKEELETIHVMAKAAHDSKYFDKLGGAAGVFSIALYAREMGIPILTALFGGLQNIQGKITMSSEMMNNLIRQKGHKIEILESTNQVCKIRGTRKDTGESYTCTFTLEDARKAGLTRSGGSYEKYADDMLFARCISKLRRRLFPDIGSRSYVEGEIEEESHETAAIQVVASAPISLENSVVEQIESVPLISEEEANKIEALIFPDDKEWRFEMLQYFASSDLKSAEYFHQIQAKHLPSIYKSIQMRNEMLMKQKAEKTV